jgi:hypothetical protein
MYKMDHGLNCFFFLPKLGILIFYSKDYFYSLLKFIPSNYFSNLFNNNKSVFTKEFIGSIK